MDLIKEHIERIWNGEEIPLEEQRELIIELDSYENNWNENNWIPKNTPIKLKDNISLSTEELYRLIIISEIEKEINSGNIKRIYE